MIISLTKVRVSLLCNLLNDSSSTIKINGVLTMEGRFKTYGRLTVGGCGNKYGQTAVNGHKE